MDEKLQTLEQILFCIEKNRSHFKPEHFSLGHGCSGLVLFYYYLHTLNGDLSLKNKARTLIDECFDNLEESIRQFQPQFKDDTLSEQLSGFGRMLLFVESNFDDFYSFDDFFTQLNEILSELNTTNFSLGEFDVFSGAIAIGQYFINYYRKYETDTVKVFLIDIAKEICKSSFEINDGVFWKAPRFNNKVYLGISHGSAMMINFLTTLFEIGVLTQENKKEFKILQKASIFLMNQKRNFQDGYFPINYPDIIGLAPTQFTLCYGDLGVAYSLFVASKVLEDKKLEEESMAMLLFCGNRIIDIQRTYDSSIIYGASGLYIAFNKLYRITGVKEFERASIYWLDNIIKFKNEKDGLFAGFSSMLSDTSNELNLSFNWGLIGIGISLIMGLNEQAPLIDELTIFGN